ncbi:UDP-glucose dehydrogenase family protein [Simkania sp.]|uniref:UDP-glucose dehydrogenase family protein n=1 Tax=Simkania sp. TaxID=34094 RepID=UPI003B52182F
MKLSVVGLGKLGSPLAALLATKGHEVKGVDFSNEIVEKLNARQAPFHEEGLQDLLDNEALKFEATTDYEHAIQDTDATFIIVPTPSAEKGLFTNRYILDALENVGQVLQKKEGYHLVVITSTVMPGSTMGEIRETLERASGKALGEELGLCYNPEFIALGSVVRDMLYPDMVLIGESDQKAGDFLQSIYESFCDNTPPVQRMNCVNAELTKLSLNTYVTTKISYANMLGAVCEALPESDVDVVTRAIGLDSRIGQKYLKAAVAFGGPCFPRDNVAFRAMAQDLEVPVDLAQATQQVNDFQPKRLQALIRKFNRGKRIGVLGLSYKPGTYVVEESPGIKVANQLVKEGYQVSVFDPMALEQAEKDLDERVQLTSSIEACLKACDTALIMTNWSEFSEEITPKLAQETACQLIIDCWRTLDQKQFTNDCKVLYIGQGLAIAEQKLDELATVH